MWTTVGGVTGAWTRRLDGAALVEHCPTGYEGDADLSAVHCVGTRRVSLVPVEDVPRSGGSLRVEPARNGQTARIRWAAQCELRPPE